MRRLRVGGPRRADPFGGHASPEPPEAHRRSPLAAGWAVPGDAGSRPTPPPPEIPREQSHRATRHSVHARARVLTATDSGLTLKVWHRPLSPAVRAATHAAPRRRAAARSWSLSSRRFSPHPMEERSGQGQWPPPKKPERLSLSKFSFTFLPPPKRQGRADRPSQPIKSQ